MKVQTPILAILFFFCSLIPFGITGNLCMPAVAASVVLSLISSFIHAVVNDHHGGYR